MPRHRLLSTAIRLLSAAFVLAIVSSVPRAGTLDAIRDRGFFLWGADREGGGPYIFPDPSDPSRLAGFEVELADMLAREIGAAVGRPIEARFFQAQWDTLPSVLTTGRIDLILNGYEWTPERARYMAAVGPYYIYELQLLVRRDETRFSGLSDLAGAPPRRVGVLGGSGADIWLREKFPRGGVAIVSYDGNTSAMGDVATGKLDATLQDLPIAIFYRKDFPSLRFAGEPVGPGQYVIYVRREDSDLRDLLTRILLELRARGALRGLYERYGIWTAVQDDPTLLTLPDPGREDAAGSPKWTEDSHRSTSASKDATAERPGNTDHGVAGVVRRHGPTLLSAAGMTVLLSLVSMPLAMLIGMGVALGRLYGPRLLTLALGAYVEVLRGTPLMLQLFVIFFLLPRMGVVIAAFPAAILGLAINYSAYEAEIYRAGIQAIPVGQMEAALSLGMSRGLALRRIVLPQALRIVIPPVTNDFIALFKDTSVCSVITVVELTKQYNIAAMSGPADILPLAAMAAILYLAMSYPLSVLAAHMERRLGL